MATGKELIRMMRSTTYQKHVEMNKRFCFAHLIDGEGNILSNINEARNKYFCHIKILFKCYNEEKIKKLAEELRILASTNSEMMVSYIHEYYGYQEIVIS